MADQTKPDSKNYWLDKESNIKKVIWALIIASVLSVLADFFYHKHIVFEVEGIPGMYAWYALISAAFIILGAWLFRKLLMRSEDYYDEGDND
jgi:putative flippase GtrA